jgi:hypothetical protein
MRCGEIYLRRPDAREAGTVERVHVIVMLLHGLGWLAFWLLAVLVVLLVFGLAVGLVAWMIDRLTFDDKLRERPDRIRREL